MDVGSRSLGATAGAQGEVGSRSLGSSGPPGFSLGWRALAIVLPAQGSYPDGASALPPKVLHEAARWGPTQTGQYRALPFLSGNFRIVGYCGGGIVPLM
jgi:hypothetical protein